MDHQSRCCPTTLAKGGEVEASIRSNSETTAATSSTTATVPLRDWIGRALNSISLSAKQSMTSSSTSSTDWINDAINSISTTATASNVVKSTSRDAILSSDEFLIPAVRIAQSLAVQCCRRETSPAPGSDWAGQAFVQVSSIEKGKCEGNTSGQDSAPASDHFQLDLEPLPFANQLLHHDSSHDVHGDFNDFLAGFQSNLEHEKEEALSYLDVADAEIVPSLSDFSNDSGRGEENLLISSLGFVFYELFSGGDKPPGLDNLNGFSSIDGGFTGLSCFDQINAIDTRADDFMGENNRKKQALPNQQRHPGNGLLQLDPTESLRLKEIPGPICDMIANMIDCVNGDFQNDDSYCRMSDVLDDLTLMLKNPECFLRGIDVTKLSVIGLPCNKMAFFGREKELGTLYDAYSRSISGKSEIVILSGPSGNGKTMLAQHFSRLVNDTGGLFLSAKFDQLKQAQPFSAVAEAFNKYCNLLAEEGYVKLNAVANRLKATLGEGVYDLIKVIPNLKKIIGDCPFDGNPPSHQDSVDPQRRIQHLLFEFVGVISSFSETPITLFLDDLQWADLASLGVIKRIMLLSETVAERNHFFFLGSCRDDEMDEKHPVWEMIRGFPLLDVKATVIPVACFDIEVLNSMISEVLCLSPRLTRPLSDIVFQKTKGNPLFFSRMIQSLNREGMLKLSLSRRRWEWDLSKIQARKLPDDVAIFLSKTIGALSSKVQLSLCVLSCFGASADVETLEVLEKELHLDLIAQLDVAVSEGLIQKCNETYSFVHDRIQEVSYFLIDSSSQLSNHFNYGLCLFSKAIQTGNDRMLFTAAGQVNRAGPSAAASIEQRISMANLNLIVGNKSIEMSDFALALAFFEKGSLFLPSNSWVDHYQLSLKLHEAAVKCALNQGDFPSLSAHAEEVIGNATCFEDKLNTLFFSTCSLAHASRFKEMVEKSLEFLSLLGEELPESTTETDLLFHVETTQKMLANITDEELLKYKAMSDSSKCMAMKFLATVQRILLLMKPDLQPFFSMKMVQLSLVYGMSPVSPIGFATYGSLLGKLGNVPEGYRFAKLAIDLLKRTGSLEIAGEVYSASTLVRCAVEPVQIVKECFMQGYQAAMNAGDLTQALVNMRYYIVSDLWIGTNLNIITEKLNCFEKLLQQHGKRMWMRYSLAGDKTILFLIGNENKSSGFSQQDLDINKYLEDDSAARLNLHQRMLLHYHKMYVSFMFGKHSQLKMYTEKYFKHKLNWFLLNPGFAIKSFYGGLFSFFLYRQLEENIWLERGNESIASLKIWSENSHLFHNKMCLLEAERLYCFKNFDAAAVMYEKSITSAKNQKLTHEEALANEMTGYFFEDIGKIDFSVNHLNEACNKYQDWGAEAKVKYLKAYVQQLSAKATTELNSNNTFYIQNVNQNCVVRDQKSRKREFM